MYIELRQHKHGTLKSIVMKSQMKYAFAALLLVLGFHVNAQGNLGQTLRTINYDRFIGKPVDSLLAKLPPSFTSRHIRGGSRANLADNLIVEYPGGFEVVIYVRKFQFMNRDSKSRNWNFGLFKKENITFVVVVEHNKCIVNCGHEEYLHSNL